MKQFFIKILFLLIIVSSFLYLFKLTYPFSNQSDSLELNKGIVDYSKEDFGENNRYRISGEVNFYWKELYSPNDFRTGNIRKSDGFFPIPDVWNNYQLDEGNCSGFGFSTYEWKMILPQGRTYGIKIKEMDCAYHLWVDGQSIECGKVDSVKSNYRPSWKRKEVFFTPQSDTVQIVLQIANFDHRKGGAEDVMVLGSLEAIKNYIKLQWGGAIFILAVLLVMGFYHLVMFLYRTTDFSVLVFSLFNFVIALRLATTGEKIWYDFFPDSGWLFAVRIEYLSFIIGAPLCVAFVEGFFKTKFSRRINQLNAGITLIYSLIVIFTPVKIFSYTPISYQAIVVIWGLYMLYVLVKATFQAREYATVLLGGYFFFLLIIINDVLYFNKWVETSFLVPSGLMLMVITQAFVLAKKNSRTFHEKEKLAEKLEETNTNLENKVVQRTQEIERQKNEIEIQRNEIEIQALGLVDANSRLKELSDYKENLTGMLVHDLKNPLNIVLNMAKDKMVEQAGRQMLNLVQNLLDVQKYETTEMKINALGNNFNQIVDEALIQVELLITHKNIKLEVDCQSQLYFNFDRDILLRVLVNLLTNAIKFTPPNGQITLLIKLENNHVYCSVKDSGTGIKEEDRGVIFSKYGQLVSKKSGMGISTGLGLAFCKLAIEAHQGEIGFVSEYGKGASFWFHLPFIKGSELSSNPQNITSQSSSIKLVKQLLSIDDLYYLGPFISKMQQMEFYEVSALKAVLKSINAKYSNGVLMWLELLEKSIIEFHEERFMELLKVVD